MVRTSAMLLAWIVSGECAGAATTSTAILPAKVHQWGIISYPEAAAVSAQGDVDQLPEFVHIAEPRPAPPVKGRAPLARLIFSALYIQPPLQMAAPLQVDITQGFSGGEATAWYPYAENTDRASAKEIAWKGILAGVQADGLETTHPIWMAARRVETATTLKRYRPGPAGSQPDDVGTTEGEVFLFARGQFSGLPAVTGSLDNGASNWNFERAGTSATGELNAWIVSSPQPAASSPEFTARSLHFSPAHTTGSLPVKAEANAAPADLDMMLLGALVGSGLDSDEANAMVTVLKSALSDAASPCLLWLVSPEELAKYLPLEISGAKTGSPIRVFIGYSVLSDRE